MKNGPYTLTIAPQDYPGKKYRGRYCYEHHLVYWKANGILPIKNQSVVHHKNHIKTDNRIENLELKTVRQHNKEHHIQADAVLLCEYCSKWNQRNLRNFRYKCSKGQTQFFCNQKCQGLWLHKFKGTRVGSRGNTVNVVR